MKVGQDSLATRSQLNVDGKTYHYYSIKAAEKNHFNGINRLPYSLKVLFENLLRFEDGSTVTITDIKAIADWINTKTSQHEIAYRPARVLMQDFTGVPAVVDLAAMRTAISKMGGDAAKISPLSPVDLVIDHSIMVDKFATADSMKVNTKHLLISELSRLAQAFATRLIWSTLQKQFGLLKPMACCMPIPIHWSVRTPIQP